MTQNVNDETIRLAVMDRLQHEPKLDERGMMVEVKDGHVNLKGKADTEEEKARAEKVAAGVAGVNGVENHLHVGLGIAHAMTVIAAEISAVTEETEEDKKNTDTEAKKSNEKPNKD